MYVIYIYRPGSHEYNDYDDDSIVLHMEIGLNAVDEREYESILVACFRCMNKKLNNVIYLNMENY